MIQHFLRLIYETEQIISNITTVLSEIINNEIMMIMINNHVLSGFAFSEWHQEQQRGR